MTIAPSGTNLRLAGRIGASQIAVSMLSIDEITYADTEGNHLLFILSSARKLCGVSNGSLNYAIPGSTIYIELGSLSYRSERGATGVEIWAGCRAGFVK